MHFIVPLAVLVGYALSAAALGHWMLGPVNRAAGMLKLPTRFQLSDFFWLMLELQLALAAVGPMYYFANERSLFWILLLTAMGCVVALWAGSVSVVSKAGVTQPLRRALVVLVLIPGTLAVITLLPAAAIVAFVSLGTLLYARGEPLAVERDLPFVAVSGCIVLVATAVAFGLRQLANWVMTQSGSPESSTVQ